MSRRTESDDVSGILACTMAKYGLFALGTVCVALGIAGMFLPVMPTTIFFIIALWAFSKSSLRAHRWLYEHPKYGPPLQAWHRHKVIPVKAKILAAATITASFLYVTLFVASGWMLPIGLGLVLASVLAFILTRPSVADVA